MTKAYQLACQAQNLGEVPVGAVIVDHNNCLIGQGFNQVIALGDPCAHAEIIAIRQAALTCNNYRLINSTIYVTLEPCVMCAGALVHARIARLVFATRDFKAGAAGSVYNLLRGYPLNHQVQIDEGVLQHESARLLTNFFQQQR